MTLINQDEDHEREEDIYGKVSRIQPVDFLKSKCRQRCPGSTRNMSLTVSELGAEDKDSRPPSGLGAEFSEKRPGRGNHGDSGSRKKF